MKHFKIYKKKIISYIFIFAQTVKIYYIYVRIVKLWNSNWPQWSKGWM